MARVSVLTLGMGWEHTSLIEVIKHPLYMAPMEHLCSIYSWLERAVKEPMIYVAYDENDVAFMEVMAMFYPTYTALHGTHLQDPRSTMSVAPRGSSDWYEQVLVSHLMGIEDRQLGLPPISPKNFDREFFPRFNRIITHPQVYYELICVAYKIDCEKKKYNRAKALTEMKNKVSKVKIFIENSVATSKNRQ